MDSISLLYPAGYNEKKRSSCKLKDYDFIRELQLDSLVVLITGNYRGMANLKLQDFFTTDEEVLKYRLKLWSYLPKGFFRGKRVRRGCADCRKR